MPSALKKNCVPMQVMKKYDGDVLRSLRGAWNKLARFDRDNLDSLFAAPVDAKTLGDYDAKISQPMDLSTIK